MIVLPMNQLRDWVVRAKPGEQIVYIHDAAHVVDVVEAWETRDYAWKCHIIGTVALFQQRNENGKFDYIVVRLSERAHHWLKVNSKAIKAQRRGHFGGYVAAELSRFDVV